jgi:hypothetical protein
LLLLRFVRPEPQVYDALREDFVTSRQFWREHRLARSVHAGFVDLQAEPIGTGESR